MVFDNLCLQKMKICLTCLSNHIFWFLLILTYPVNCHAGFNGSLTGTTDYIWHGYSKSDGKPVIQANIDYEFKSGIYLGTFFSTVNFADNRFENRSHVEFRPYLGWAYKLSDNWRLNTEWVRYIYDGRIFGEKVDYNEFYFYGHFRDLLSASFAFSEDAYQQDHMSFSYEITGRYPITDSVEMSGTLGYSNQLKVLSYDYLYQSFGLTWHILRNIGFDIRYYKGQEFEPKNRSSSHWQFHPHVIDDRFVFSITVGF